MKKKRLLFFGNCQLNGLKWATEFLEGEERVICTYIANYETICLGAASISEELRSAIQMNDVVILQPLSDKWGAYSKISSTAIELGKKVVKLPYIFIDGLFAIYPFKKDANSKEIIRGKKEYLQYKHTLISTRFTSDEVHYNDPFDIKNRFSESWKYLRKIEKQCDIYPSRHLIRHFRNHRLMLTQNHTDSFFQLLLAEDLLGELNISFKHEPINPYQFSGKDFAKLGGLWPIDKFTVNALKLNYQGESNYLATRSFINSYAK